MKPYEIIEHTAEIGIKGYGRTQEELFANMAAGMFGLIVPPEEVREVSPVTVTAQAEGPEELLVAWLRELIVLFDTRHFLGKRFQIQAFERGRVSATVIGETLDLTRHSVDKEVKAATYCDLKLEEDASGIWSAQVIFDI